MNIIAFYLPQFHEIPENNEWWGNGFTEWTSVKAASPLFTGHKQPKEPYKGRYYNLLDKDVMKWQSDISQKAGIYGFCFYHYWFKGKKLLEKPVENYLKWTDISQRYCLSWANESWIRTWSNVEGNDWNEVIDKKRPAMGPTVLMKQDYGNESDWAEHFYYLLSYFNDPRYIRFRNKPVFLIYKPDKIPCLHAMLKCWNRLAKENGLEGIYVIATNDLNCKSGYVDAAVMYEPAYTLGYDMPVYYKKRNAVFNRLKQHNIMIPKRYSYDCIWNRIIERKTENKKRVIYQGGFVNFDDTPRRGKNGTLFCGVSPEKFKKYLKRLLIKNQKAGKEFVFLTAWNEWAEGAYLEPDQKNGYAFLKAIRQAGKNEDGERKCY